MTDQKSGGLSVIYLALEDCFDDLDGHVNNYETKEALGAMDNIELEVRSLRETIDRVGHQRLAQHLENVFLAQVDNFKVQGTYVRACSLIDFIESGAATQLFYIWNNAKKEAASILKSKGTSLDEIADLPDDGSMFKRKGLLLNLKQFDKKKTRENARTAFDTATDYAERVAGIDNSYSNSRAILHEALMKIIHVLRVSLVG